MKRVMFLLVSSLAFGSVSIANELPLEGNEGRINFTGNIVEGACTIDSDSKEINVTLDDVNKSLFDDTDFLSAPKAFNINLKNCLATLTEAAEGEEATGYSKVVLGFRGTAVEGNSQLLALGGTSTAQGVGIQVYQSGKADNPVTWDLSLEEAGTPELLLPTVTESNLSFNMIARYQAIGGQTSVTAGSANATGYFMVNYK